MFSLKRNREKVGSAEESDPRFFAFMRNLPGLAWLKDSAGRYVFANERALATFGKTAEELYGHTDAEIFPPATATMFTTNDLAAVSDGGIRTIEVLTDAGGVERHSVVSKFPVILDGGDTLVGGIAIDITEQSREQQNRDFLFRVSEQIRTAVDVDVMLGEIAEALGRQIGAHRCLFNEIDLENDVETVYRDYSPTGDSVAGKHKISSYSAVSTALMNEGKTIVNHDSSVDARTAHLFEQTYGPAKELAYIAVPMLRDGVWVASLWVSDDKPRYWRDDEVELVESIAERVWASVERLRSSQMAARNQKTLYELVERAPFGIYIVDANLRIATMNARFFESAFGAVRSVIGTAVEDAMRSIWPDEVAAEISAAFRHTLESGEPFYSKDFIRPRRDTNKEESYEWELHRIDLPEGRPGVVCYSFDSTGLREAERALRAAHEELKIRAEELTRFNRAAVGRELRMIELKREVNALLKELGRSPRFPLDFEMTLTAEARNHGGD